MTPWTFDQLPANLPTGHRYVTWKAEPRGKVPYVPSCPTRRASVTDPATWDTFATARGSYDDGKCAGVGLVLTGDLTAVDLDHCLDAAGALAPEAAAVLAALPTYAERGPSGDGAHLLLFGTLPPGRRRRAGLEVYDRHRFITLTGWRLADTSPLIVDQAATLTALYPQLFPTPNRLAPAASPIGWTHADAELLEKAHHARNGARFTALWAGDTSAFPSPSEADLELCRQLSFWTQRDPVRIDALFRQSGLFRSKWDELRGADTYGARTIALAIALTPTMYRPPINLLDSLEVPMV